MGSISALNPELEVYEKNERQYRDRCPLEEEVFFLIEGVQSSFLDKQEDLKPKALALIPSLLLRLLSFLAAGSNAVFGFVLGNIPLITMFLYSSASGPDKLRGSKP